MAPFYLHLTPNTRNNSETTTEFHPAKGGGGGEGQYFQADTQLNNKIAVWCGSIAKITADACVLPCTEMLRTRQPTQSRAVYRGQQELQQDIFNTYRKLPLLLCFVLGRSVLGDMCCLQDAL